MLQKNHLTRQKLSAALLNVPERLLMEKAEPPVLRRSIYFHGSFENRFRRINYLENKEELSGIYFVIYIVDPHMRRQIFEFFRYKSFVIQYNERR